MNNIIKMWNNFLGMLHIQEKIDPCEQDIKGVMLLSDGPGDHIVAIYEPVDGSFDLIGVHCLSGKKDKVFDLVCDCCKKAVEGKFL